MKRSILLTESELREALYKSLQENINRNGLYDFSKEEIGPYIDTIWRIMQDSYEELGGFKSYTDKEKMADKATLYTLYFRENNITAAAVYNSTTKNDFKMVGIGKSHQTEGDFNADVQEIIKRDIRNFNCFYWAEVSGVIEHWFKKHNGFPIPNHYVKEMIPNGRSVKSLSDDGYHYIRLLGPHKTPTTKCVFGFRDSKILNEINTEFCTDEFQSYEDFRKYVNSSETNIQEESNILKYQQLPQKVSWAIGFIATLDEYNNEGLNELTPYMIEAYNDALATLNAYSEEYSDACRYLEIGEGLKKFVCPIIINAI